MTRCVHCDTVRRVQATFAWGGQPLTPAMNLPDRYLADSFGPGRYDGDPGPCPCGCHDVWRILQRGS